MASAPELAPYGGWTSPLSAQMVASAGVSFGQVAADDLAIYWTEGRPSEAGRSAIVRCSPDGDLQDVGSSWLNARTRVHEYGGGSYCVSKGVVYTSHLIDGRVYRLSERETTPLTPEGPFRYADLTVDERRHRLICVSEDHSSGDVEPVNSLVAVHYDVSGPVYPLVRGADFYSNPRVSPDGTKLCWLSWNHPNMPWDGTELWVGTLDYLGAVHDAHRVAGGQAESIFCPQWSSSGELLFLSDRTGRWNFYRLSAGASVQLTAEVRDFGVPQWQFGLSTYAMISETRIVAVGSTERGTGLFLIDISTGIVTPLSLPFTAIAPTVAKVQGHVICVAAGPQTPWCVVRVDPLSSRFQILKRSSELALDTTFISIPQPMTFQAATGESIHAFFYGPCSGRFHAPRATRPPL
ncbi:MAG: hypothetical protein M1296_04600 [Chloroflexi bacterium]|nr:hypothetical protein [Chloroflexota bacterium]